eukprot:6467310-Amphidinium_carterae.1
MEREYSEVANNLEACAAKLDELEKHLRRRKAEHEALQAEEQKMQNNAAQWGPLTRKRICLLKCRASYDGSPHVRFCTCSLPAVQNKVQRET